MRWNAKNIVLNWKNKDGMKNENKCDFKSYGNLQVETFFERNFDGKEMN